MTPVQAVVPEPVEQVVSTVHTVFLRAKSGKVYSAFRYLYNGPDTEMPDFLRKTFPLRYSSSLFKPVSVGSIRQIIVGRSDQGGVVYLIGEDGSVLSWNADQSTREAFMPGLQAVKQPSLPDVSFSKLDLSGNLITEGAGTAYSNYVCFASKSGQAYFAQNGSAVKKADFSAADYCITPSGFLFRNLSKSLFFYGTDDDGLFTKRPQASAQPVTWFEYSPIQ